VAACNEVSGKAYLSAVDKSDPRTLCTSLGKILPTQVTADAEGGPVRIEFSWLPPHAGGS
jgi:hypothetical protein